MMRFVLELRLSRLSVALIGMLSALATVVILSGASHRTPAETAALAALRQAPVTRTVVAAAPPAPATRTVVAAAPPAPATTPSSSPSADAGNSGSVASGNTSTASAVAPSANTGSGSTSDTGASSAASPSGAGSPSTSTPASADSRLPKVGHVFEIALSTTRYQDAFGSGHAPYLDSLKRTGALLSGYRSLGSSELVDNLAMISGQAPNADTRGGCTTYSEFPTAVVAKANGLVPGNGCVYPETALTIGDQVSAGGQVWRAYIEGMGKQTCLHPNSNAVDDLALPGSGLSYDSRHNPFIYFHSLLDLGDCSTDDQDLSKLPAALSSTSKTPRFAFLAPSACSDARAISSGGDLTTPPAGPSTTTSSSSGTASTTATTSTGTVSTGTVSTGTASATATTSTGTATTGAAATPTSGSAPASTTAPATTSPTTVSSTVVSGALGSPSPAACPAGPVGIAAEDAFLKTWVPRILSSPAYKKDGVLVIAFTGAGVKPAGPQVRTGALVLSRFAPRGKTITTAFSPYSLLRSLEDMLRYTPLAKAKSALSFASTVLTKTK